MRPPSSGRNGFFALALLALAPLAAQAQTERTEILPDVVITADREPTPTEKVTGSVTVITGEEMQRRQLRTLDEVLRWVPGVSIQQSGGIGSQTAVFIRGFNSNQTVVLLDGMNVGDPSTSNGAVDLAHFLTENLDRIEVVRGPMSTLYGSAAMGGVINMVTKPGKGPLTVGGFTELGTRLQSNTGVFARGSEGRFNYNVSASGLYAPGETVVPYRFTPTAGWFADNESYRNITIGSRLGFELNDNAQFTWFSRFIDTQLKFDQVGLEDPNAIDYNQQFFNRLQFDGSFFDNRWRPTIGVAYGTVYRHTLDFPSLQNPFPFTKDATYNGRRLQADWKNEITISDQINFVGGIDYEKSWLYANVDKMQSWGDLSQTGIYGQLRGTFFDDLTLSLAGRVDLQSIYGTVTTWRAGAAYIFRPTDTKFKASYGTAFKAPSLFELYGAGFFCAGNLNLQPEYSRGYEFGVEQGMFDRKVTAGITYFFNSIYNLIQCPPPFTSLENVAKAQTEGFEMFLQVSPFPWMDLRLDYTFTIAFNVDTAQPLVRRPQDVFSGRLALRPWDGVRFGFEVNQVSNRNDFDAVTGAIIQPAAYTLLRATAGWYVRKGVELFARAENILDRQYEEPEGFKAPSFQAFFGVKATF